MAKLKIGFIGYKGHAGRLIKIFGGSKDCRIGTIYHPDKNIDISAIPDLDADFARQSRDLSDLLSSDIVVISSPNATHFGYLKYLSGKFRGYVFCEKPPVSSLSELERLERSRPGFKHKVFFNFNMRFSLYNEVLGSYPSRFGLGELVSARVITGHGLAFKPSYRSSWRADKRFHPGGVLETLGCHYLDLFMFNFGGPEQTHCFNAHLSPYGDSWDTSHMTCLFENKAVLSLTCSYCVPCSEAMYLVYTNGTVEVREDRISVFGPRDTFDKKGFFIPPPLKYEVSVDMEAVYESSLEASCRFFLSHVRKGKKIGSEYFDRSLLSNKVILKALRKGSA